MAKTWALLGLVLVGLCMSDAFKFKQRKRQSSSRTQCCYPKKHAWNMVRKSKYYPVITDDKEATDKITSEPFRLLSATASKTSVSETIETIEIADEPTTYHAGRGSRYGWLNYVENLNTTYFVSYNDNGNCFDISISPYDSNSYGGKFCLDKFGYSFDKQEKKNGVNYYVFFNQEFYVDSITKSKLYATVNEALECSPRILTEETDYFSSGRATGKVTTTTSFSDIEMGPEQEELLQLPDESKRCKTN